MILPDNKKELLDQVVGDLKEVKNIKALVLGGSYATGDATDQSDLDIGIYYDPAHPFEISEIESVARKYAIRDPTVTGFYEWGPWVNGGAWIETANGKVDFIYRNIDQVKSTIAKAKKGEWETHYDQQPPFGFVSIIYLAETKICIPLFEEDGILQELKAEVEVYPPQLREKMVQLSLWSAEFSIWHIQYFQKIGDFYSLMGSLTRTTKNLVSALFALNEIYPLGDKRAVDILSKSSVCPKDFKLKMESILCVQKETVDENIKLLRMLFEETISLSNGLYKSFYVMYEK